MLELLALDDAFEELIAIEDLALVPKPAPEAYARALARMGAAAGRCTFVDDTLANAAAGAAAGLRAVWLAPAGARAAPPRPPLASRSSRASPSSSRSSPSAAFASRGCRRRPRLRLSGSNEESRARDSWVRAPRARGA